MNYVKSHYRGSCGFLLCAVICSLAFSLKADVDYAGGAINELFHYDGCSNAQVSVQANTVIRYGPSGSFPNGFVNYDNNTYTVNCNAGPGEYHVQSYPMYLVGGNQSPVVCVDMQPNVVGNNTANTSKAVGAMPEQIYYPLAIPVSPFSQTAGPCTASYSPWPGVTNSPNPCAGVGGNNPCPYNDPSIDNQVVGFNNTNANGLPVKSFAITNNSGAPELITGPNGSFELQPGQGTVMQPMVPWGTTNVSVAVSTLNNQGGLQDAGGDVFGTLTNSGSPNWSYSIASNSTTPLQNIGANGMDLASSNGGPIVWSSGMDSTQVLEAGFNGLLNGNNQSLAADNFNFSNLVNALTNGKAVVQANITNQISSGTNNSGLSSNVWVQNWPSNFAGGSSNVWVRNFPLTNSGYGTNQAMAMINTNQAFSVLTPVDSAVSTIVGALPSTLSDDAGSGHEEDITLGNPSGENITLAVGTLPSAMSGLYVHLRNLIAWLTVLTLLLWNAKTMFDAIRDVLFVEGAEGPDTGTLASAVGGNALTAVLVAATIITAVSVIPTLAVGFMSSELTFWSGTESPSAFFPAMGWQYSWVSQYIPVAVFVTALGSRIAFWFAIEVIKTILEAVAKALVGM